MLLERKQIADRVAEMGHQITRDFSGESVIFVGVLKGAAIFLSDLARQVDLDATFDFIGVSSYGNRPSPTQELQSGWDSTGEVRLTKDVDHSMLASPLLGADATCSGIGCSDTRCALRAQPASTKKTEMPISALHLEWKRKGILFASPDTAENGCSLSYTHSLS